MSQKQRCGWFFGVLCVVGVALNSYFLWGLGQVWGWAIFPYVLAGAVVVLLGKACLSLWGLAMPPSGHPMREVWWTPWALIRATHATDEISRA